MPTPITYYLNAPSLGSATAVFTDAGLTTCAPDGFYSDGNIVREQVSCVLLPQQECPACDTGCGTLIGNAGPTGVYYYTTQMGAATGAIIIRFNPFSAPDGIIAYYDGVAYNALSSVIYGTTLPVPYGLPVYLGRSADDCGLAGSTFTLDEYMYDSGVYVPLGSTTTVYIDVDQVFTYTNSPMNCLMVIPKPNATPSVLNITVIGACSDTLSSLEVSCPAALPAFNASVQYGSSSALCAALPVPYDQTYYIAPWSSSPILLQVNSWVFTDPNGEHKMADGYYSADKTVCDGDWFRVQDGIIVQFGNC